MDKCLPSLEIALPKVYTSGLFILIGVAVIPGFISTAVKG